jgi:tetratricopeptide (TPR) repeat protein
MAGIFISYRRVDLDSAFLLQYWLKEHFGQSLVFWDKQDIGPGEDFGKVIQDRVSSSNALIALIGSGWVEERKRLDAPNDWVRVEIATALAGQILVVPVLASKVANLSAADLPAELKKLAAKQSLSMADLTFHSRLMQALQKAVPAGDRVDLESLLPRVGRLLLQQLARLQVRAVELIQDGKTDRAVEELHEGFSLMMELIQLSPPGLHLDVQLGYLYKTLAQAFDASGHRAEADHYLALAYGVFLRIKETGAADQRSLDDIAGALNGIGNVHHGRDELEEAIRWYRRALEIEPRYAFAWHDLFAAADAIARKGGVVDLVTMREALAKVVETGAGLPGLGEDHIALLRRSLDQWEHPATHARPKPAKTKPAKTTARRPKKKTARKPKRRAKPS